MHNPRETSVTIDRDAAIRTLLINTATRPAKRHWTKTALIASIAFLMGGGIAAGALSAAAVTEGNTPSAAFPKDTFSYFLHGGHTIGPILSQSGTGSIRIDLGPRPARATGMATFIECGGTGKYTQTLGGEVGLEQKCSPNGASGFSSDQNPTDTIVATKTDGNFGYKVWAQWIYVPAPSGPSAAQQAALSDGVITEMEYHAAVDRFAACMSGAGYPITDIKYSPTLSWGNSSDANRTGVVDRCSDGELNQVLRTWQTQH
jgi:hypothetical protein